MLAYDNWRITGDTPYNGRMNDRSCNNDGSFVVNPQWIAPVVPTGTLLEGHCVVVREGRIVDLLTKDAALAQYADWQWHDLPQHILIPGLINAHGHAAMTLLRGYADDKELMDWLNNYIWPVESKFVDYTFTYDGTSLAIAEMISTGTTCAADTYFFPDAVAAAYTDNKFRAQVCAPVIQFGNAWASTEEEHIDKALAHFDAFQGDPLINPAFAPHAPYTVTDKAFESVAAHAERLDIPIHLHLHETSDEVKSAIAVSGKRPMQRMTELGLVSSRLQTIHMTQLTQDEIEFVADNGIHVAHCPDSNLKLASGFCPVTTLVNAGVNVAIGTDGAASNNNLDMLAEMRSAALLAKGISQSALSVNAHEALAMGTINGAKMLGLEKQIGSLEVGKRADYQQLQWSDAEKVHARPPMRSWAEQAG